MKSQLLETRGAQLAALLKSSGIAPETFVYSAITQLQSKPELLPFVQANPGSFIVSVMQAAEQGLDFSRPNEAHLVGYNKDGRPNKLTLQRGYKGWLKLARESRGIVDVDAVAVYEHDQYARRYGAARTVDHIPPPFGQPRGEVIGFYAVGYLREGGTIFDEMTADEVLEHAKRFTKAAKSGPFAGLKEKGAKHENFIPYGLKTVVIRLCNRKLDLSSKAGAAIEQEFEEIPEEVAASVVPQSAEPPPPPQALEAPPELDPVIVTTEPYEMVLTQGGLKGKKVFQAQPAELENYLTAHADKLPVAEREAIVTILANLEPAYD